MLAVRKFTLKVLRQTHMILVLKMLSEGRWHYFNLAELCQHMPSLCYTAPAKSRTYTKITRIVFVHLKTNILEHSKVLAL